MWSKRVEQSVFAKRHGTRVSLLAHDRGCLCKPLSTPSSRKSAAGSAEERRRFQGLREHQTLPAELRIRGEPAQARQCILELSAAAVGVENQPFVCSRLRRHAIDEHVTTGGRVAIQDLIISALQNDRGERRIKGVTIK